ncbi:MAG: T9SS type A sorting domain-containing protein [Candidatus Marinimicrobia bacterium]|nr:T9SS type A sorting domain-containing protein [Candidatus Neomarinimicrobiota bacterium]
MALLHANPFNPVCIVPAESFTVSANVNAVLYDINGRLIRGLHNGALAAGSYDLKIDGAGLSTGIYFVHVRVNDALHVQKIALMK